MVAASAALFVYFSSFCQRAAEDVLRWMAGSVSGDEHRFRCCTVGELLRDWDCVSVIAVREQCDKKGLRADWAHRSVRCRQLGRAPFGYPPRLRSGLRQNRAGFLEKREKGRTPSSFRYCKKRPALYSLVKLAHPPTTLEPVLVPVQQSEKRLICSG